MKIIYLITLFAFMSSCGLRQENKPLSEESVNSSPSLTQTSLIVLGTLQDGGSPHIACTKDCCKDLFENPDKRRKVVSLGIVDPENHVKYLFEATPDITEQMKMLKEFSPGDSSETPDGIFITHAHIGHYTGLMYLGKAAMNANKVAVFVMPKMKTFLESNLPWSQLVASQNIVLQELEDEKKLILSSNISVVPVTVPHRDEYSETVGFKIIGPNKKVLFIPDIDKWEEWDKNIIEEIAKVDYAFLDATFYNGDELNTRNISGIPHPFITTSMSLFADLSPSEKKKIYFIHLNHTNPALNPDSDQTKTILQEGFNVARINETFEL